jgi:hypothetical protein
MTKRKRASNTSLPESMISGKARPAKAADGDAPVFACIASLPRPQRAIAERIDSLAAKTLPGLERGVEIRSMGDLDLHPIAEWMKQVAAAPGVGKRRRGST